MKIKWSLNTLSATAVLSAGLLFNTSTQAAYINDLYAMSCTEDSVTMQSITKTVGGDTLYSGSIQATSCAGMFLDENDDSQGASSPAPNIGELYDGFLNSEPTRNASPQTEAQLATPLNTGQLDPLTFIEESDLQDLDGDGDFTDPGWIHLAHINGDNTGADGVGSVEYSYIQTLNLSSVLDIAFDCDVGGCTSGTWTVSALANSIADVSAILGENSFDHLAFVFKGGKSGVGIYDFDFKELVGDATLPNDFNFSTPYTFSGIWNMDDLKGPKGQAQNYSHVNIWARDPATGSQIPEPATIALFGLGLLGLAGMRKRKMA